MKIPATYKSILKILIQIAEHGNDYAGDLTHAEQLQFGAIIAGIQNDLGELNETLLDRLGLYYDGSK